MIDSTVGCNFNF